MFMLGSIQVEYKSDNKSEYGVGIDLYLNNRTDKNNFSN